MTRRPLIKKRGTELHQIYARKLDKRRRKPRLAAGYYEVFEAELGGPDVVSEQRKALLRLASTKAAETHMMALLILDDKASDRMKNDFLRWSRELRMTLITVGLERISKPVQGLSEYITPPEGHEVAIEVHPISPPSPSGEPEDGPNGSNHSEPSNELEAKNEER